MSMKDHPNQDALYTAVNIYLKAMRPFIFRNMKKVPRPALDDQINHQDDVEIADFPHLVRRYWNDVFAQHFDPAWDARSRISLIKEARNRVSHPRSNDIESDYAFARLEDIVDVLGEINAPEQALEVKTIRDKLAKDSHVPVPENKVEPPIQEPETKSPERKISDLTPWRDVISPNSDVIDGTFRKSEFAADLQEVYEGRARTATYGDVDVFFNQTYITPGLRGVMTNTLKRLGNKGGAPVVQLKTGFGGGKTHSLIALYHLITGASTLRALPTDSENVQLREEIEEIMQEAGWDPNTPIDANVSVLVGTYLSTTDTDRTDGGDPLNTLWGRMADQLGGQDAYEIIGEAARQGISPGGKQLDDLFRHVGPSVILIDELVAYTRNVQSVTRDSIYSFVQSLTESVSRCENIVLVVTLPKSQTQAGAEIGNEALKEYETIFSKIPHETSDETLQETFERKEEIWEPLDTNQAFEVVRRRLFGSDIDEVERDRTCEAYRKMYQKAHNEYPEIASDQKYLQRMKDCYPIHPEVFDRLYNDWSAISAFQRTRGVLRIMANCISRLYQKQDPSPLIMPANFTLDDAALGDEFAKLLGRSGGNWKPVLTEVDSDSSLTDQIDMKSEVFLRVGGAARRVARTVFFGSATGRAARGITTRDIHLGTVVPGEGVSVYNDALNRMRGNLYFLYKEGDRYYFHAEENLNKVATDRVKQYNEDDFNNEIILRLGRLIGRDPKIQVCPTSPSMVEDSEDIKFVILPPQASLSNREKDEDTARPAALNLLTYSGEGEKLRIFKNTLLFITAKRDDIRNLNNLVKDYLAWYSILNGDVLHSPITKLDGTRLDQTKENLESSDDAVTSALIKAYRWALAPLQEDPKKSDYSFSEVSTKPDDGKIINRIRDQFIADETIIDKIAPSIFSNKLQQYVWSNDIYKDHIDVDTLWELLTQNVYMPRLRDRNVLSSCIKEGVLEGLFGFALEYIDNSYVNLRFEDNVSLVRIDKGTTAVLINPELAKIIKEEQEKQNKIDPPKPDPPDKQTGKKDKSTGSISESPQPKGPKHVVITKTLQLELPFADEIGVIQDEIVRTLKTDGGNVKIEVVVTADKSEGFSENTTRSVKLNSEHIDAEFKSDESD